MNGLSIHSGATCLIMSYISAYTFEWWKSHKDDLFYCLGVLYELPMQSLANSANHEKTALQGAV